MRFTLLQQNKHTIMLLRVSTSIWSSWRNQ